MIRRIVIKTLMSLFGTLGLFLSCFGQYPLEDMIWVLNQNIGIDFRTPDTIKTFVAPTTGTAMCGSSIYIQEMDDVLYTNSQAGGDGLYTIGFVRGAKTVFLDSSYKTSRWAVGLGNLFVRHGNRIYLFSSSGYELTSTGDFIKGLIWLNELEVKDNTVRFVKRNQFMARNTCEHMAITRHANGHDWWVIVPHDTENHYFFFIIDSLGVRLSHEQTIGDPIGFFNTAVYIVAMRFNATGSQLALGHKYHPDHPRESSGVMLFDFDRCTGRLSNYKRIPIPKVNMNYFGWGLVSLELSACSRYLYLNRANHIARYNLARTSDIDTIWRLAIPAGIDSLAYVPRGSYALKSSPYDKLYFGIHYRKNVGGKLDFYSYPESPYDDQLFEVNGDTVRRALTFFDIPGYLGFYLPNVPNYALGPLVSAYAYQRNRPPIASICPKYPDSVQLGRWADTRNLTYHWAPADGLSDPTDPMPRAKPSRTTTYTLTVRALPHVDTACGGNRSTHSDTIRVEVYDDLKPLDLSIGARVCGQYIELNASNTGFPVIWSTGDTTQTLRATSSGTYTATSASARCAVSDTISITIRDSAQVNLPADTTWCPSWGHLELRPDAPNARRYFWSTRETTPAIMAADTGMYWVRVVDEAGCVGSDSIRLSCPPHGASIDLLPASGHLFIPNAFSPNADGLNETFQLLCGRCVFIELQVFNRLGGLVFESHDLRDAWDGRHMPEGVYAYRVRYRLSGEATDREERGVVSVVR